MKKADVVKHFEGNPEKTAITAIAEALGVSKQYISQWPLKVPEAMAARLEKLTGGELEYRLADYVKE